MVEVLGQHYQHATSKFTLVVNGVPAVVLSLKTVKKISASSETLKENTNDAQGQVDGFVVKPQKNEGSLTLKESEWFVLRSALATSPGGPLLAQFTWVTTYGNGANPLHKLELFQTMIQKEAYDSEDTQDPHMMELPLIFQKMLVDGVPPVVYEP